MKLDMENYKIFLYSNELKRLPSQISKVYKGKRLYIITDENVFNLYSVLLKDTLLNYEVNFTLAFDKSFVSYQNTIEDLLKKGIRKDDLIVGFGGGTVGDLAGFIAATLFRGIDYIQIPTTLLSQIDSSVGGKTAIDLKQGKNLVGSFYNPKLVFIDTIFLDSLEPEEYVNGFAEAIKMAITLDEEYYNKLRTVSQLDLNDIKHAISLKREVVKKDPYDLGERRVLNFGHTYGHAIEKETNYSHYKHGEAISYGMLMALQLGVEKGITPQYIYNDLEMVLLKNKLIITPILDRELFKNALYNDKKNDAEGLNFVFLEDIGKTKIINVKIEDL